MSRAKRSAALVGTVEDSWRPGGEPADTAFSATPLPPPSPTRGEGAQRCESRDRRMLRKETTNHIAAQRD